MKNKENDVKILPYASSSSTLEFIKTITETKNYIEDEIISIKESHSIRMEEYKPLEIENGKEIDYQNHNLNLQFSVFDEISERRILEEDKNNKKYSMRLFGDLNNVTIKNLEINVYMKTKANEIVITECGLFSSLSNSTLKNIKLKIFNNIRFDCKSNSTSNGLITETAESVVFENIEIDFYKDNIRTLAIENKDSNVFGMISGEGSDIEIINCNIFGDIITVINNGNNTNDNSSIYGGLLGICVDNCEIRKSYIQVNNILLYQSMIFGGLVGSLDDGSEMKIVDSFVYIEDGLRIGVSKEQQEFVYGSFIGDTNRCDKLTIDNSWIIFITMGIEINTTTEHTNFGGMIGRVGEMKEGINDIIIITNSSMQMPIGHNTFVFRNNGDEKIESNPNIGFIFGTNITNIESYRLDYTMAYVESCNPSSDCISPQMCYQPTGIYPTQQKRVLKSTENNYCSGSGALVEANSKLFSNLKNQGNDFCDLLGKTTCEGYNGICYDPFSFTPCKLPKSKEELVLSKERMKNPTSKKLCPNNCNSKGVCVYGECRCFPGFTSFDCKLRTCPFGNPISNPSNEYDKDNRINYECSNQGKCNRENGLCECYNGFEGNACQRTKCPNECNNHGICMTLREVELNKEKENINDNDEDNYDVNYMKKYEKWDKESIQVCVCDKEYRGTDCSIRKCPYGYLADSECDSSPQSVMTITYSSHQPSISIYNKIYVKYTDPFNRIWYTKSFKINERDEWLNALGSLPPDSISMEDLTVIDKSDKITIIITFSKHQTGRQYSIEIIGNKEMKGIVELEDKKNGYYHWLNPNLEDILNTEKGELKYEMEYTQRSSECSNNGICDVKSGICKCFDGFRGISCSEVDETI